MKQLYQASDGKIFTDFNKGVTHQALLNLADPNGTCRVSMDGGRNWDWEYGYPDGRAGWHRPLASLEADLANRISDIRHEIDGEYEMDVAGAMPDGWLDPLYAELHRLEDQLARLHGYADKAAEMDASMALPFDC